MPGEITHIALSRHFLSQFLKKHPSGTLLLENQGAFELGSLAPDLAYHSSNPSLHSPISDHLHYSKTNRIPISAFEMLREQGQLKTNKLQIALLSFYLGYCSHLVADCVFHPFVRDKVGDYESHSREHKELELQIDVILSHHLLKKMDNELSGIVRYFQKIPDYYPIIENYAATIHSALGIKVDAETMHSWICELDNNFAKAGEISKRYSKFSIRPIAFSQLAPYEEDILTLKAAIDALEKGISRNFLNRDKVHFLRDGLPKFTEQLSKITGSIFDFIDSHGSQSLEKIIPSLNLDIGRLENESILNAPYFWKE